MEKHNNSMDIIREIGNLQLEYESLVKQKKVTKKAICELVIPFKEKYYLTDKEALAIARNEIRIDEMVQILEDASKKVSVSMQQDVDEKRCIELPCREVYAIMDRHPMSGITYLLKKSIRGLTIREIEGIDKKGIYFSSVEKAIAECQKLGIQIAEDDEYASYHRIVSNNEDREYEYDAMEFPIAHRKEEYGKHSRRK